MANDADDPSVFLTTERLLFRGWQNTDFELALALWGDPGVTEFIVAEGRMSVEEVAARLSHEIDTAEKHGMQYWPVFLRENGGHVGCCGLRPHDPSRGILEIGFHIRSSLWGRGYAAEAARGVINHAFSVMGAEALFAGHNPRNAASRKLLEKLGFVFTHEEYYAPTGLMHPSYLMGRNDRSAPGGFPCT